MQKIKTGDEVLVIAGKYKGQKGVVRSVHDLGRKVTVEGVGIVKKHESPDPNKGKKGGIVLKTLPIDRSNVMLVDAASGKRSRVGIKTLEDGKSVRYLKSTNNLVDSQ